MDETIAREQDAAAVGTRPDSFAVARYAVVALALATAAMYVMVALQVVHVSSTAGKESPFVPMAGAAAAYLIGAALVALRGGRIVYILGALVQVGVIIGYFAVAPSRDPNVEAWGLVMKGVQLVLLGLLGYLAIKAPAARTRPAS